jgi:MtN3 and saliva related transmembrane protein
VGDNRVENWIGSLAALLTTISFVPQAMKVLRERETKGISLWMYLLFTLGVGLWFVFGLLIHSFPVYAANGVTLVLASSILAMKIRLG